MMLLFLFIHELTSHDATSQKHESASQKLLPMCQIHVWIGHKLNNHNKTITLQARFTRIIMSPSSKNPTVLVAGGCGYIGTHTIVCLLQQNYDVVVVDNLVNSNAISLEKVAEIVGLSKEDKEKRLVFHKVDICDEPALRKVFESSPKFISCIHFAGLKVLYNSLHCMLYCDACDSSPLYLPLYLPFT
jgi:hypothetical protein